MAVKYLMGKKIRNTMEGDSDCFFSPLHHITSHHILPNITKGYQVLHGENQPEKDTKVCCS